MPDITPSADTADILWFLPTHGDGRYLGTQTGARHVTLGYLSQIARGGRTRLFRRVAAHRSFLRGFLGHRLGYDATDPAPPLSRRRAAGPVRAVDDRAHGGDAGSPVRGAGPDQRRRRRGPRGNAR